MKAPPPPPPLLAAADGKTAKLIVDPVKGIPAESFDDAEAEDEDTAEVFLTAEVVRCGGIGGGVEQRTPPTPPRTPPPFP